MERYSQIPPVRLADNGDPLARDLRRRGICIGVGLIGLSLLSDWLLTLFALLFPVFGISIDLGDTFWGFGFFGFMLLYGIVYAVMMGLPMTLSAAVFRMKVNPFGKREPLSFGRGILWLFAGLGMCMAANNVANVIMNFLLQLGIPYPDLPDYVDGTVPNLLINILIFAVLPGILEEVFFRGYVLELFRPYNRVAALFISALFFGLMHANVLQIPFAFMVGLALGLIYLRTGNIFLCMGVHFLNNMLSELELFVDFYLNGETAENLFFSSVSAILLVLGVVAGLILFFTRERKTRPMELSGGTVWKHGVWRAPTMIVAAVLFLFSTLLGIVMSLLEI